MVAGGPPCEIEVNIVKIDGRKNAVMKDRNGQTYRAPVFMVRLYLLYYFKGWRGCKRLSQY